MTGKPLDRSSASRNSSVNNALPRRAFMNRTGAASVAVLVMNTRELEESVSEVGSQEHASDRKSFEIRAAGPQGKTEDDGIGTVDCDIPAGRDATVALTGQWVRRVSTRATDSPWDGKVTATNAVTITVEKLLQAKLKNISGAFKDAPIAAGDVHLAGHALTQAQIDALADLGPGTTLPSHSMTMAFTKEIDGKTGRVTRSGHTVDGIAP